MDDYCEQTKTQVGFRTLKIAILALACLGLFMVLLSLVAHNASAVPVPTISGSLTVSTDTVWDSGTANWYGTLTVNSPAKLTIKDCNVSATYMYWYVNNGATMQMNNVTVTFSSYSYFYFYGTVNLVDSTITMNNYNYFYLYNPTVTTLLNTKITQTSSMYFYANDYSKFNLKGASIIQPTSYSIYMYFYGYSTIRIDSSYLKNIYYMYCYGYDVQISNSSLVNGYYGVYAYTYGSANWGSPGPIIKNCLITGKYYPVYAYMWGNGGAKIIMEGNLILSNSYYVFIYGGGNLIFNNNTVIRNNGDGLYLYQVNSVEFNGNNIQGNGGVGLRMYFQNSELVITGNTLLGNSGGDVWLYSAKIRSVNNTVGTVTCQQSSEFNVYWLLSTYVGWLDGTGPVSNATLEFIDAKASGLVPPDITGADGWLRNVEVKQYTFNDQGKQMYSPYQINATLNDFKNIAFVNLTSNSVVKILLDNIPPVLDVESPINKLLTNRAQIHVQGITEPGANCTVNSRTQPLDKQGLFSTDITFTGDGNHDVKVVCMDASKNTRSVTRTVVIDTKAPSLSVTSPAPDLLTNDVNLDVIAKTDAGSYAEINGKTVTVDATGTFERTILLDEGDNEILVRVWDKAGNIRLTNFTITLDTIPPNLIISDPKDGDIETTQDIRITGQVEQGSILKINNLPVKYQGNAFQYSIRLVAGQNSIALDACDAAGNHNSKTVLVSLGKTAPSLTLLTPVPNLQTNQKLILVSGRTDPTDTVTINGDAVVVDPVTGYFERSMVLNSGANKFNVMATDPNGNSLAKSATVIQDDAPPSLMVTSPDTGAITNHDTIKVEGVTEPAANVTINGITVQVKNGKFNAMIGLDEGNNEIDVVTTDGALNAKTLKLFVMRDSTVDLRIATPYNGQHTYDSVINVTGSSDSGSSVFVNTNLKASIDMYGNFKAMVSLNMGDNDIKVTSTDSLGNTKTILLNVTRDKPLPTPPEKVHNTNSNAINLSGSGLFAQALVIGLIIGAVLMAVVFVVTRMRFKKTFSKEVDNYFNLRFQEKATEETKLATARASGVSIVPKGYKGPPIHLDKPQVQSSVYSTQAETVPVLTPEAGIFEVDPAVAAVEQRMKDAEAKYIDTTRARNSLKLAKFYMAKGDKERMDKYLQKTTETLNELGA